MHIHASHSISVSFLIEKYHNSYIRALLKMYYFADSDSKNMTFACYKGTRMTVCPIPCQLPYLLLVVIGRDVTTGVSQLSRRIRAKYGHLQRSGHIVTIKIGSMQASTISF